MPHLLLTRASLTRYEAIVDLTRRLNANYGSPHATRRRTKRILQSLFPPWLPSAFKVSAMSDYTRITAQAIPYLGRLASSQPLVRR